MCNAQASKEGGGVQVAPTQCASWTNQRVAQQGGLKALDWHIWTWGSRRTCLACFKSAGGFLFFIFLFFPSSVKTIRPGAVKGQKTDPERDQKANANN